jgi:transcriptional regulator with XRE-family HTH domain
MVDPIYVALGKSIRHWRNQRGWTQQELADELGYSRPQIANIELGNSGVSLHVVYDIASLLRVSPGKILPTREQVRRTH